MYCRNAHLLVLLSLWLQSASLFAQNAKQAIEIPLPARAKLESQDTNSIEFVAPANNGHAVVKAWLDQFKAAGWSVKVVDEDLPFDGEYELTKNGMTIEVEFDDPSIVPADIEVSCRSPFRLQLKGASQSAPTNPGVSPKTNPPQATEVASSTKEFDFEGRRFKETLLGSVADVNFAIDEGQSPTWWTSPNAKRFAYVVGLNLAIHVDGKQYEFSPVDGSFVFSPDSLHFATASTAGGKLAIMIDGHTIIDDKANLRQLNTPLVFSSDSQHVACLANDDEGKSHLLIDGVSRASWQHMVQEIAFSSDSRSVLCAHLEDSQYKMYSQPVAAGQAGRDLGHASAHSEGIFFGAGSRVGYIAKFAEHEMGIVFEGVEQGERLIEIKRKNIRVAHDGSQVAYMGDCSPIRNTVVFHGKRGPEHNPFEDGRVVDDRLIISRDSKRLAYVLEKDALQRVVVDGKLGPAFQEIANLEFSPDGSHFAYLAMKDGSPLLVLDGVEGPKHALVSLPNYSDSGSTFAYYAEIGGKQYCVVNGQKHPEHDGIDNLSISSDGSTVAYVATDGNADKVVVNGKVGQKFDLAMILGFYPQTNRLVYLGRQFKKECLVDDGKLSKLYDFVRGPACYSTDGKHLAVTAIQDDKQRVLVDGKEDPVYDYIVELEDRTISLNDRSYWYYAAREKKLYKVEVTLPQ